MQQSIHGEMKMEAASKLRDRVIQWTQDLYKTPPKLNKRYQKIPKRLKMIALNEAQYIFNGG
jgi:hypothetical protein